MAYLDCSVFLIFLLQLFLYFFKFFFWGVLHKNERDVFSFKDLKMELENHTDYQDDPDVSEPLKQSYFNLVFI